MYPDHKKLIKRKGIVSKELEVLLKEKKCLNHNIELLEAEKCAITQLEKMYELSPDVSITIRSGKGVIN